MTIEESKRIQTDILKELDAFCRANGIRYTMAYGTLLGAVRHGGWIPWDDDIDIHMLRSDFEKFLKEFKSDKFELLKPMRAKRWEFFARIVDPNTEVVFEKFPESPFGVWLTIFPVDNRPDNDAEWNAMRKKIDRYANFARLRFGTLTHSRIRNICKKITHFVFSPVPIKWINGNIMDIVNSMADKETEKKVVWVGYGRYETYSSECFKEFRDMNFGDFTARAISNYDLYLKASYGDYMQLPPVEVQQSTTHDYIAYYK